jgi:monoamine oxidase
MQPYLTIHAAVRAGKPLSREEHIAVFRQIAETEHPKVNQRAIDAALLKMNGLSKLLIRNNRQVVRLPSGKRFVMKYRDFFSPDSRIETQVAAMTRVLDEKAWTQVLWEPQREHAPAEMFANPLSYLSELRRRLAA